MLLLKRSTRKDKPGLALLEILTTVPVSATDMTISALHWPISD